MSSRLVIDNVSVSYGEIEAVKNFSLTLEEGEIGCLLGPSGCGKTTLLRAIAGFESVASGSITLKNHLLSSASTMLPAEKRRIGMVFQDFALFPHLSVEKNILFGARQLSGDDKLRRLDVLLKLVGLEKYRKVYPHELSGGQQQRVALARAMATRPDLLLMDEPFSSLDAGLREQLAREVRDLFKQHNMTALVVTHDQQEAFLIADKVAVMQQGELMQWDSPYAVYHSPASRFVAQFIGQGTLIKTTADSNGLNKALDFCVLPDSEGKSQEVLIRPDDIIYDESSELRLEIVDKKFGGAETVYSLKLPDGQVILCAIHSHIDKDIGETLPVRLDLQHRIIFPT